VNFISKTKAYFLFSRLRNSAENGTSTCSMASVVTAFFLSFQLLQAHFIVFPLPFQLLQVLFCEFLYFGVAVMPHKYIFQSKGIGSSEYRTIM
jgi:hypothetical protein